MRVDQKAVSQENLAKTSDLSLLVSYPHQRDPKTGQLFNDHPHSLSVVTTTSDGITNQWIDLGFDKPLMSYGLAQEGPGQPIFHTASGEDGTPWLFRINPETLRVDDKRELRGIKDPHSIAVEGDTLFVVSSGNDRVYGIPVDHDTRRPEVVYQVGPSGRTDTRHLNSLALARDGRLLVTGFGLRDRGNPKWPKWSSCTNGFVADAGTGEILMDGISQPHTVFDSQQHGIIVCESRGHRIADLDGNTVMNATGYTRGLAEPRSDLLVVGDSSAKGHPDNKGQVGNHFEDGVDVGGTKLYLLTSDNTKPTAEIYLNKWAPELYDILSFKAGVI